MTDFEKYLLTSAVEIKKEVKNTLSEWSFVVEKQTPSLKNLNKLFIKSFDGGKYVRGTLVKLGYELFSTSKKENISVIKTAAAFEILHTALLIHDDVMDKSLVRRGKPAIHAKFKNEHLGISQAISLGDLSFFLAIKLLSEEKIVQEFSDLVLNTILGQMLDVKSSYENSKKEKDILNIHKLKTAHYTISGPLSIGAMLGGANEQQLSAIKKFGEYLGIAYQIQDDILGVFGDEKKIGKSTSSDIKENKNTLLISYALKKADLNDKQFLQNFYGNKKINKKQIEKIKKIFMETDSLNYSQKKIEQNTIKAMTIINKISSNNTYQNYLYSFADFIIKRQK